MSFASITLCLASQRVFNVVRVYFVVDSVRKLLDTPCLNCGELYPNFLIRILLQASVKYVYNLAESLGSSVSTVTTLGAGRPVFESRQG